MDLHEEKNKRRIRILLPFGSGMQGNDTGTCLAGLTPLVTSTHVPLGPNRTVCLQDMLYVCMPCNLSWARAY